MSLKEENEILKGLLVHDLMSSALEVMCDSYIDQETKHIASNVFYNNLLYAEKKSCQSLPELRKLYEKTLGFF
jgi:hypothetical protein